MREKPRGQRLLALPLESPVELTREAQHELARALAELLLAIARSERQKQRGSVRPGGRDERENNG